MQAPAIADPIPLPVPERGQARLGGRSRNDRKIPGPPFAAEIPVPQDASAVDRLAGFLGRPV